MQSSRKDMINASNGDIWSGRTSPIDTLLVLGYAFVTKYDAY
jgi:hypothetical protein